MQKELQWEKLDNYRWLIKKVGNMKTEGIVYADDVMFKEIQRDMSLIQVSNVAELPGIVGFSLGMPDIHEGYGFPIGGVAAFNIEEGIVSPGGVGYDINCGVRLISTKINYEDIKNKLKDILNALYINIPSGVGSHRKDFKLGLETEKEILKEGAKWAIKNGFGNNEDLLHIEENGCIPNADPSTVSQRALERGKNQLGTLGSGNHFVEIGVVQEVYDEKIAEVLRLQKNTITITIHTGSRGLGYQICDDYISEMLKAVSRYSIELSDKQLCCAPIKSPEGRKYLSAMACAANYAFANRQMIMHWVNEVLCNTLNSTAEELKLFLVYDVCHNIAKFETHKVAGKEIKLLVHRKGATRAFPPYHPSIPKDYYPIGQPVLIPGDMGRYSYVLVGTKKAFDSTFGSTCHGAGRVLSRRQAINSFKGRKIADELEKNGIIVKCSSKDTLLEEASEAYKDVSMVVNIVDASEISKKVARLKPLGVIKG